jgi:SSS family transporter
MGFYFARRERSTRDFFLADGRIPWWAAGLSIFATMLSAITYLAIPARTFATDWVYFPLNCGILLIAPVVAYVYLPFFRRLDVTTAYEYLERRFDLSVRMFGSVAFVGYQLGRMGIVVLLPALALSAVTGLNVYLCIVLMGGLATIYTALGGIEAVIWTDVLQTAVLIIGAVAAIFIVAGDLPGGFGQIVADGATCDKYDWYHLGWDLGADTVPVILLSLVFINLVPYTSDQAVIQRYLTTRDEKRAARAIWTNGILCIPASLLFFGVGTALFVYFREHPVSLAPLEKADQIFPWFIAQRMPAGLAGLVFAGVFAAAMSSLDSGMHSIATVITNDFVRRFRPGLAERTLLVFARWLTVVLGALGTMTAILMAGFEIRFLWDLFLGIVGLLLGTLGGLFTLGIFLRRPSAVHAWIGLLASLTALLYAKFGTAWNGLLYAPIGVLTCVVAGGVTSLIMPVTTPDTGGLTLYSIRRCTPTT